MLLAAIVVVLVGTIIAHDEIVDRGEFDPFIAHNKARWSVYSVMGGCDQVTVVNDGTTMHPEDVTDLGSGKYEVRFQVNRRRGSDWSPQVPLRCTMLCRGLDDWVLQDYQLGDSPSVRCDYEYPPTGQVNRLWSYRIFRGLTGRR